MKNKAEQKFEQIGFWNMQCVKVSQKQQEDLINYEM